MMQTFQIRKSDLEKEIVIPFQHRVLDFFQDVPCM